MWSGALDRSHVLQSYLIKLLALHITTILISTNILFKNKHIYLSGIGENSVDMVALRKTMPWSNGEVASEVVPGLIWAGNASAAKLNPILDQGITLVINCTNNMGNLEARLPHFRCKTIHLKDKPVYTVDTNYDQVMAMLEKTYDWIEVERRNPERAILSDPVRTLRGYTLIYVDILLLYRERLISWGFLSWLSYLLPSGALESLGIRLSYPKYH